MQLTSATLERHIVLCESSLQPATTLACNLLPTPLRDILCCVNQVYNLLQLSRATYFRFLKRHIVLCGSSLQPATTLACNLLPTPLRDILCCVNQVYNLSTTIESYFKIVQQSWENRIHHVVFLFVLAGTAELL